MDESGHDHRQMPYEVRGGIALHASELWAFVQGVRRLELDCFGCEPAEYKNELKGSSLLDKKRFKFANQGKCVSDVQRRRLCRSFFTKGLEKKTPTRDEFTAYGQACILMAEGIFDLLKSHKSKLFASAIPKSVRKPATYQAEEYLRKDQVFLLERFFYMLEAEKEHGILVLDEVEKTEDRRFVKKLHRYFSQTTTGRFRSSWIVPSPFFVSSDMTSAVQAADLCIYCVNWGFRLPYGMNAEVRKEISDRFSIWLSELQFRGQAYREGRVFSVFGIVYVPDPYTSR
ncbi:MAG: DUF3800 domain-containing protein [bacterium]|nr:DUF3800 domain-containing protein [bacterium]